MNPPAHRRSLVRLLATATACGAILWALVGCDAISPADATSDHKAETFCAAWTTLPDRHSLTASIRAWDKRFAEIDPPDDMPELARSGMRVHAEVATREIRTPSTGDESLALDAFHSYATGLCGRPPLTLEAGE